MKCQNCGAEIGNSKTCEYCGSKITAEMQKEQEQLNKIGCPKCGSSNISFRRENQGEFNDKKSKQIVTRTVGVCNDCGATWFTDEEKKKRKTWLWVLGWIFIFPLPLTLILLKKKDMKPWLKYGIIAVAWILYLILAFSGNGTDKPVDTNPTTNPSQIETTTDAKDTTENTTEEESSAEDESNEETEESAGELTGIRPEIKEALEDYEAFFDEYIAFMEKYENSDNTAAMLVDYAEYMQKYSEAMDGLDKMDDMEMSPEEDALYTETMVRVNAKLAKYAYSN